MSCLRLIFLWQLDSLFFEFYLVFLGIASILYYLSPLIKDSSLLIQTKSPQINRKWRVSSVVFPGQQPILLFTPTLWVTLINFNQLCDSSCCPISLQRKVFMKSSERQVRTINLILEVGRLLWEKLLWDGRELQSNPDLISSILNGVYSLAART